MLKKFSDMKLQTAVRKLGNSTELFSFATTIYQKIGIFIDTRCQDPERVKSTFNEVSIEKLIQ